MELAQASRPAHEGTLAFWIQSLWDDGSRDDAELIQLDRGGLRVVKNVTSLRLEFKGPVNGKEDRKSVV